MRNNQLGETGISVSELSFGTLILGRLQANLSVSESEATIQAACEAGINLFDTAQSYGTEEHLGKGLGSFINDVIISTKTHARKAEQVKKAFEQSLKLLRRDYLDIYQMHLIDSEADLASRREVLDLFLELKEKGLIRAIGASVHKAGAARVVARTPEIDVLFPVINEHGMGIIDGTADDMLEAMMMARENGQGVMAMKPLAGGHLREEPGKAFDWLKETKALDTICVGMKTVPEVLMNTAIFNGTEISEKLKAEVETVPRTLRIYERCIGCGACVDECKQDALAIDYEQKDKSRGKDGQSVVDMKKCILCGYCAEVCPEFTIRVI